MSALSFCIVTAGNRNQQVALLMESIRAQNVPEYEIIVAGAYHEGSGYHYVNAPDDVAARRIGRLRNLATERSRLGRLVILDDDMMLTPGWWKAISAYPDGLDVVVPRVSLVDGGRLMTRARRAETSLQILEDFDASAGIGPFNGCGWVVARSWAEAVPFEDAPGLEYNETLAWVQRATASGARIFHCLHATAYSTTRSYTTVGSEVFQRKNQCGPEWVRGQGSEPRELLVAASDHLRNNRVAEAADCLRYGAELYPGSAEFLEPLTSLEEHFGGRISDARWYSEEDPVFRALRDRFSASVPVVREPRVAAPSREVSRGPGMNLFGFFSGNLGLGVAARHRLRSFQEAGIDVWPVDIPVGGGRQFCDPKITHQLRDLATEAPHDVNVFALNPGDVRALASSNPPAIRLNGRINISMPFWELPRMPPSWVQDLEAMDVVVASSHFIEYALLASVGHTRVRHIPQPVYIDGEPRADRHRFGIDEDSVVFMSSFEVASDINRKNPFAAIDAFSKAFPGNEDVRLVIKVNNPQRSGPAFAHLERLQGLAHADRRIVLISQTLSYSEVLSLYASADVYVSLHRAEGLGLGMLETMALAKPVIATGWSGNMEFMNERSACLVRYELIPVEAVNQPAYQPDFTGEGANWAEPNVMDAAGWMVRLAEDPGLREKIGREAERAMRERAEQTGPDELIAAVENLRALRDPQTLL